MNNPMICVIVPVYKVEKYLDRCIQSLLNQTYKNIKIVLVDDGSPDSCSTICENYKKNNLNITVIHQKNKGLSSARNSGLDEIKKIKRCNEKVYVGFVDSDDWVAPKMYETLLNIALDNNAEVSQINFFKTNNENCKDDKKQIKISKYNGKDILQYYLTDSTITGSYSVWRCLFDYDVIEKIRFRDGKINEDIDFKYKALSNAKTFVFSNEKLYYYWQSTNSLTTSGLKKRDFDLYDAADELWNLCKNENYGSIKKLAAVKKARTPMSLLSRIAYYGISDTNINKKEVVNELVKEHRQNLRILLNSPIPISRKIISIMFAINYQITEKSIKLIKNIIKE